MSKKAEQRRLRQQRQEFLDRQVLAGVSAGHTAGVAALLASGASVDGSPEYSRFPPIIHAAGFGNVSMISLLVNSGANVNIGTFKPLTSAAEGGGVMAQGCRALHVALRNGHVGAYRSLLKAGADPNAADTEGHTSLMAICNTDRVFSDAQRVVALRELLQAGGDASLADVYGCTAMHFAVCHEDGAALIDLLRSNSPSSLTKPDLRGVTPLRLAALHGWPSSITHLLSLGATQPIDSRHLPLLDAVVGNHASSVRVLLEAGLEAVGGPDALMTAILQSFDLKKSGKVLGLLLAVNGEAEKQRWANTKLEGTPILHMAAALAEVALLSVLLAAGADETAVDPQGISAFAMTGTMVETDGRGKNPAEEAACRRMLERAPAFRAVSWSFPARASDDTDARKRRGRALGVRVFRPRKRTFFLRHVGRREGSDGCLGAVRYGLGGAKEKEKYFEGNDIPESRG